MSDIKDAQKIKDEKSNSTSLYYRDDFAELLYSNRIEELKQFVEDKINWGAFTFDMSFNFKSDENLSYLAQIIRTNNIELVDYFINLSQYKSDPDYLKDMSYYIAYGFKTASSGDNLKILEYYESLHDKLQMDKFDIYAGLNEPSLSKVNGKLVVHKHLFKNALENAVFSSYNNLDIIHFILEKKDKYGAEDCNFELRYIAAHLDADSEDSPKNNFILKNLGYTYDSELFKAVYNIVKSYTPLVPSLPYLILEKNIPYDDEIKELIKGDPRVQNLFLYRKLDTTLVDKNIIQKSKI